MRKSMRQTQAGLTWERRLDGASAVRATLYAGTRAITQYQAIPVAAQKAPTSAGGVIDLGRDYGGLDLRWARNAEPQDGEVGLIAGLAASVVRENRQGYANFVGEVLGVQGALATGDSGHAVRDLLAAWRNNGCCRLRERFQRAVDDGELPPETDPGLLARYVTTLVFGIAVQAASGVGRDELQEMADAALRNWPLS